MKRTHLSWRSVARAALVVSCIAYFATLAVVGLVADGSQMPAVPAHMQAHR